MSVRYEDYHSNLHQKRAGLNLPTDCKDYDPVFRRSAVGFWTLEWLLEFSDRHYIRVWEHYCKIAGVLSSRRTAFSFHFGPITSKLGEYRVGGPVVMRIDGPNGKPVHLHYLGPTPHYMQEHVSGLRLDTMEMFLWIDAVLRHRQQRTPLHQILNFKVKEPA